jgi:hypothetical protein
VIKNVTISNTSDTYISNGSASVYLDSGAINATFTNVVINNYGTNGKGIVANVTSGTTTFNNCNINGSPNYLINFSAASTFNFINCAITANGNLNNNLFYSNVTGAVVNTTNSFVQGPANYPQKQAGGPHPPTWNSINDIVDGFPYYTSTKTNFGYITFYVDDSYNVDYATSLANYAMKTYGLPITYAVDEAAAPENNINNDGAMVTKLQALVRAGDEVAVHTKHHNDLSLPNGINVTYSGANTNMALVISGGGTSLSTTGTSETHGPINLTTSPNNTLGGLCTTIAGWTHYTCSVISSISPATITTGLKDTTTALPQNTATGIHFDDNTGAANRYFTSEITNAIADIETAIHGDPTLSSYHIKVLAWPYNNSSTAAINWIKANTSLAGARYNYSVGNSPDHSWLGHIDIFNAGVDFGSANAKGTNYSSLTDAQKKLLMQQAARIMATTASNGFYSGMLNHTATNDLSLQDFQWFLDELVKYTSQYHIKVVTLASAINDIVTSGNWTNSNGSFWDRTFSGSNNLNLLANSPMINAGITISGRITDILGNPIVGLPDIGAYEFQSVPPSPSPTPTPTPTPSPTPTPIPFTISGVSANNFCGANVSWTTSIISSSKVDYGLTSSYGNSTLETDISPRVLTHSVPLSNLNCCTTYRYRVRSKDNNLNEIIGNENTLSTICAYVASPTP